MRKIQMRLQAFLCIITMLVSVATPSIIPANTTATSSALNKAETSTSTDSALSSEQDPSTATGPALEDTNNTSTSSGSSLNNGSDSNSSSGAALTLEDITVTDAKELPRVKRVVLPTITDDTYDFVIDVDGLLSRFNENYAKGDSVYFTSILSPARLRPASYRHTLVVQTKTAEGGQALIEQELLGKNLEDALGAFPTDTYFLWQPNHASDIADGQWLALTADNLADFMEFELDEKGVILSVLYQNREFSETEELIWDGNIYTTTYTEISPEDAAAQFFQNAQPFSLASYSNAQLYVKTTDGSGNTSYYPATLVPGSPGSLSYRPAVYTHAGASVPAVITNKSTFDICVTAELQVYNGEWLTFCASPDFGRLRSRTANIWLAFTANAHQAPVESCYTSASYILPGISRKATPYLIISGTPGSEVTGIQYQYLSPLYSYSSIAFQLEAAIDTRTNADSAWDEYINAIVAGTIEKPAIDIVYKITEVTQDPMDSSCYLSETGTTYIISDSTEGSEDYWVETVLPGSGMPVGQKPETLPRHYYTCLVPAKISVKKRGLLS